MLLMEKSDRFRYCELLLVAASFDYSHEGRLATLCEVKPHVDSKAHFMSPTIMIQSTIHPLFFEAYKYVILGPPGLPSKVRLFFDCLLLNTRFQIPPGPLHV